MLTYHYNKFCCLLLFLQVRANHETSGTSFCVSFWFLLNCLISFLSHINLIKLSFLYTYPVNCLENRGQIHETNEIIMQSISILVRRNPFCLTTSSIPLTSLLDLMAKEIPEDVLSVERAEILYNICWLSLKSRSKNTR